MALSSRQLEELRKKQKRREKSPPGTILARVPPRPAKRHTLDWDDAGLRLPVAGGLKMSEVISHLAEPLIEEFAQSQEEMRWFISLAVAAWNNAMLGSKNRSQMETLLSKCLGRGEDGLAFVRWAMNLIDERRRQFYPELRVSIIDVRFTPSDGNSIHFMVAYTPLDREEMR
jgi:hypothetical protein